MSKVKGRRLKVARLKVEGRMKNRQSAIDNRQSRSVPHPCFARTGYPLLLSEIPGVDPSHRDPGQQKILALKERNLAGHEKDKPVGFVL